MKIILATALMSFFAVTSFAQVNFKNTQWKGQISSQGEVKMDFKSDTIYIYRNGNELISTFTFYKSQDTVAIFKVGGMGSCAVNGKGIYRIEMLENGEKFNFHLISEECPGRGMGLTSSVFERIH
jgi:hypothetical protein